MEIPDRKTLLDQIETIERRPPFFDIESRLLPTIPIDALNSLIDNQTELLDLTPRDFELLVAELLEADGNRVEVVSRHNAPGPDVIGHCEGAEDRPEFIIECKRWKDAVGVDVIRSVVHRKDYENKADRAIVVTSGRFTRNAAQMVERFHRFDVDLIDGSRLHDWLHKSASCLRQKRVTIHPIGATVAGEQIKSILRHNHFEPELRISAGACQTCGGPIICGRADVGVSTMSMPLSIFAQLAYSTLMEAITPSQIIVPDYPIKSNATFAGIYGSRMRPESNAMGNRPARNGQSRAYVRLTCG